MNPNIFLSGPMGSGKTYLAKWLVNNHGYTEIALADMIKVFFVAATGKDINKGDPECRKSLQRMGASGVKASKTLWCDIVMSRVISANGPVVISDGRFKHEADYFHDAGFIITKLVVDDTSRFDHLLERDGIVLKDTMNDPSETSFIDIHADIELHNSYNSIPKELVMLIEQGIDRIPGSSYRSSCSGALSPA